LVGTERDLEQGGRIHLVGNRLSTDF
jgi:hypothetical protein